MTELYSVVSGNGILAQDVNQIVTAVNQNMPNVYNVQGYGATGNGTTDDTSSIASAIAAASTGGIVYFPPGTYKISSVLNVSNPKITLMGAGTATILQPSSGFSSANMINITANNCAVRNLQIAYATTTYSSNPAADAIQITGATDTWLADLLIQYVNGWAVQTLGTAQACYNTRMRNVKSYLGAKGFHFKGVTASNYGGVHVMDSCYASLCQAGDSIFLEDIYDISASNVYGECQAGSGNALHIHGACNAIQFSNVDLGYYPGPSTGATVLIESSSNGGPNFVTIEGGIIEGGSAGVTISQGNLVLLSNLHFYNNGTYGVNNTGGDAVLIRNCAFSYNGSSGTTGRYDLQNTSSNHVSVQGCYFYTGQGTTAQTTNNAVNSTAGNVVIQVCAFYGTGYTASNIFNNKPTVIRNCSGYNPVGGLSAPTIPTSGSAYTNAFSVDCTVCVSGGTVTGVAIGGTTTGLTTGAFRVPAGQTITLTYSVAPSWVWIGD